MIEVTMTIGGNSEAVCLSVGVIGSCSYKYESGGVIFTVFDAEGVKVYESWVPGSVDASYSARNIV